MSTEYIKTNWQDGDIITADKMNNIENGIKDVEEVATGLKEDLSESVGDLKNALTELNSEFVSNISIIDDEIFTFDNEKLSTNTVNGWKIVDSGFSVQDSNYKLVKYTVTAGQKIKIVTDGIFQFQNSSTVPGSGTSTRVGPTYYSSGYVFIVPTGATHLVFSITTNGTSNVYDVISSVSDHISDIDYCKSNVNALIEKTRIAEPVFRMNNSYISTSNGKVGSSSDWSIIGVQLNAGETLSTTMAGSGCSLSICEDSTPTASSTFNVIFSTSAYPYNISYTTEEDVVLYISSYTSALSTLSVIFANPINVNYLDGKIDNLSDRIDGISDASANRGTGYSLDYNNAFEKIDSFDYSGADNPWTELENLTDFETYGTYIDNKIESIPEGASFIWIADVHYSSNRKRSGALVDYVRRRAGIKTILHGGDVQNERPYAIDAAKDWLDFNKDYVGRIGSDFKQVCGDHDHNGQCWGNVDLREQYGLTDPAETFFTCRFVQKVLTGYCENEIVFDTTYDDDVSGYEWSADDLSEYNAFKKMYYYFDDGKSKTRFIVLFTDWAWKTYGFPYNKLGQVSALYVQMEFLYRALSTVPDNYNVVICGHDTIHNVSVTENNTIYFDRTRISYNNPWKEIVAMLTGFRNKDSQVSLKCADWSTEYQSTSEIPYKAFNFSGAPSANVVMTIGGDVHWDITGKTTLSQIDTIAVLDSDDEISKTSDILHAITMTDGLDRGYLDYATGEPICHAATAGTIHEQAFDVVTINDKGIFFTRIGSGSDRSLLFVDESE